MTNKQATKQPDDATPERETDAAATTVPELQVLRIGVQDMQCAIDLDLVERVFPLMELRQVPGGPHYLAGLMNYHGESLAVVDLSLWLGKTEAKAYNIDTPVVLCNDGQLRVGFVVNQVMGSQEAATGTVQMQDAFDGDETPFLASLDTVAGMVLLLDMRRIMKLNFIAPGSSPPATKLPPSQAPA